MSSSGRDNRIKCQVEPPGRTVILACEVLLSQKFRYIPPPVELHLLVTRWSLRM